MSSEGGTWLTDAEKLAAAFAKKHGVVMRVTDRQLSAAFEIGSLHALLRFYEAQGYRLEPRNLTHEGEYRYLTSPSGNPANFSWVEATGPDGEFEIRQQVRVQSHIDEDIAFTPDIVVLLKGTAVENSRREEYASGRRPYYRVKSLSVVAAHECKSMNPFPELMVSFIGMLVSAHEWYPNGDRYRHTHDDGHLGPTLFVGGTARNLHLRMISAMQKAYHMNIICGLHEGTWSLTDAKNRLLLLGDRTVAREVSEDEIPF